MMEIAEVYPYIFLILLSLSCKWSLLDCVCKSLKFKPWLFPMQQQLVSGNNVPGIPPKSVKKLWYVSGGSGLDSICMNSRLDQYKIHPSPLKKSQHIRTQNQMVPWDYPTLTVVWLSWRDPDYFKSIPKKIQFLIKHWNQNRFFPQWN